MMTDRMRRLSDRIGPRRAEQLMTEVAHRQPEGATWTGDSSPLNGDHIVDWDGPNYTHNPRNWPGGKRWAHVIVVALLGLLT